MSIFKDLSDAIGEVVEHLQEYSEVNAFIVKAAGENPYSPIYVLNTHIERFKEGFDDMTKNSHGETVAIFALIR